MSDILKEAIADAKAVRETALQNAKMALEEAFAPHLKNMLSAKLSEEDMDDEPVADEDEVVADEPEEDWHEGMEDESEEGMHGDEEEEGMHKEEMDDEEEEGMHKEEMDDEEEEGMHGDEEEEMKYEEEEEDEELDLEAIIKELELEVNEEEVTEGEEEIEENDVSSDIGNGDNKQPGKANQSSNIGNAKNESVDSVEEAMDDEEEEDKMDEDVSELESVKTELGQYKEAVEYLQDKLHEVNVLNAKLLFTNKLFKEYALDKDQKMKVVETMDRAQTTREIKLVYSTLAEAFGQSGTITRKQTVKESASNPVGSTKPKKKIISEENKVADRFKKLAGII